MNILVTGAQGFIGRNLVEKFLSENYQVQLPTVEELDLTNSKCVEEFFKKNSINIILHAATTLRNGLTYPTDSCEKNLRMFFNLLRQMTPDMKMINLGSGSEYSRQYWFKKMDEKYFCSHIPSDSHSFSKYIISKYIENNKNLNLVTLRIFGIFGKYEDFRYKFISNAIAKNLMKMPITINQNVIYDYIYINDFYEVVKYFVNNEVKHSSYNITPTNSIDLISIAKIINEISDYESKIHVLNDGIGVEYSGNNHRMLTEIGNFNFTKYNKSIFNLFGYYKKNISKLDRKALINDEFLEYAKRLRNEYFIKLKNRI